MVMIRKIKEARNENISKVVNPDEDNRMLTYIDGGLWLGALGVASTIRYLPGATVREIFEVQRLEARNGALATAHTHYKPGTVTTKVNGAQEILANTISLGAPAVINHYNNPGWELLVCLCGCGFSLWSEIYSSRRER